MKRAPLFALIAVLIVCAVSGVYVFKQKERKQNGVATVSISRGTIEEVVTAQGKMEAKNYVDVGAQISGQIKKLYFEIGDNVKAGQLVAELDPRIYAAKVNTDQAGVKSLEAQITEQNAQIEKARQQFERDSALIKSRAISREALEESEATYKVAVAHEAALKAQLDAQRSTLEGDLTNLSYTKIYAPMDGTVVSQNVREGQTLNAIQQAPVIMQIANLDIMSVRAQVAEADVMRLRPGMDVYFSTLGALDHKWHGKVRQILPTPEVVNDVVLYDALVDVDNSDRQLMMGMSTQMFFVLARAENVLRIPVSALRKRLTDEDSADGQAYSVTLVQNGNHIEKTVHIGLMNRTHAEIRRGLNESDSVVDNSRASKSSGSKPPMMGPRL
ncbi:MAG TPA: efflux RND transporter periplasmic adaptor subunit [Pseudomonadales bacterium]|nr:efflux RND transporter periplasmic adaptor subunit [Pseudomonadales bacterium]